MYNVYSLPRIYSLKSAETILYVSVYCEKKYLRSCAVFFLIDLQSSRNTFAILYIRVHDILFIYIMFKNINMKTNVLLYLKLILKDLGYLHFN